MYPPMASNRCSSNDLYVGRQTSNRDCRNPIKLRVIVATRACPASHRPDISPTATAHTRIGANPGAGGLAWQACHERVVLGVRAWVAAARSGRIDARIKHITGNALLRGYGSTYVPRFRCVVTGKGHVCTSDGGGPLVSL